MYVCYLPTYPVSICTIVSRDMFVDPDKRPKKQFMYGSFQYLLDGEENEQVPPKAFEEYSYISP